MFRRRILQIVLVWAVAGVGLVNQGGASGVESSAPRTWVAERWTVEHGLPVNALTDIVQTLDGYLWVASFDGLLRFDGVRFERFEMAEHAGLESNRILEILADSDGTLWVITEPGGLTHLRGGEFRSIERPDGLRATAMAADQRGMIWVATTEGLFTIRDERLVRVLSPAEVTKPLRAVAVGPDGTVCVSRADDLAGCFDGEGSSWFRDAGMVGENLLPDGDGGLWVGAHDGLFRLCSPGRTDDEHCDQGESAAVASLNARRRAGLGPTELWWYEGVERQALSVVGDSTWKSEVGIVFQDGVRQLELGSRWSSWLKAPFEDDQGNLWLTSSEMGLVALRPARVETIGVGDGLVHSNVLAIHQDRGGAVWVSDLEGGLIRIDNGCTVTDAGDDGQMTQVLTILDDPVGGLLLGTRSGLKHLVDGRQVSIRQRGENSVPQVRALLRARDDRLIIGSDRGLFHTRPGDPFDGEWQLTLEEETADMVVRAIVEDGDGGVWFGTVASGLIRYDDPGLTRVGRENGLPSDSVRAIHVDSHNHLWIGTEDGGLCRLDPRSVGGTGSADIDVLRKRHGLLDNGIHQILEDADHRLWLSTNQGIFTAPLQEFEDVADGRLNAIEAVIFNERDGMRNREANGGAQGAGTRTTDGRMWFPTQAGVAIINPTVVDSTIPPPHVAIEYIETEDGRRASGLEPIVLQPELRSFDVRFTALALRVPERSRFRYRLEGYQERWTEAGTRRYAEFTKVPPGRYSLRVQARSADGVWNREGAVQIIEVLPFWWETLWFKGAVGLALLLAGYAALRLRERSMVKRQRELERLVDRRTEELVEANRVLEELAGMDDLTSIPNIRTFRSALDTEWRRHQRNGRPLSLILLDLDYFKSFNDRYGHLAGDEALQAVARQVALRGVRATDLAARYGGEEFAALLPETDLEGAVGVAESIRQAVVKLEITHEGSDVAGILTISSGVACIHPTTNGHPDVLIARADKALYRAKRSGRNRVRADGGNQS